MTTELRAKEYLSASDSHIVYHIAEWEKTDAGICGEFRGYFQKIFTRETDLSLTQFDNYLTDFPRLNQLLQRLKQLVARVA